MTAESLILTDGQLHEMAAHAEAAFPEECCGLLVGTRAAGQLRVSRVVAAANVAESGRNTRFEVDPAVRIRLMRELRGNADGHDIIGHYHSHPGHGAHPSATDAAQAHEPELVWVILSVFDGQARETAAHLFDEAAGAFREIAIKT